MIFGSMALLLIVNSLKKEKQQLKKTANTLIDQAKKPLNETSAEVEAPTMKAKLA